MLDIILEMDGRILLWIQEYLRNDLLTPVMKFVTHLGDAGWFWIALTVVFLIWEKWRETGFCMAISLFGTFLANNIFMKEAVARTRPYEVVEGLERLIGAQKDLSFPSGHAGSSFAVAVVILWMCPERYGVPAMILAMLISFSRLYLGVHYPTDVACGALVGSIFGLMICRTYFKGTRKPLDDFDWIGL